MSAGKADRFWSVGAPAPLSCAASESGTGVPHSKTLRARRGGVLPPYAFRLPSSGLSFRQSCGDYGISGKRQKTYGSVFGMIFLRKWGRCKRLKIKSLQAGKQEKACKTQEKVQNSFRGTHVFLQKAPLFRAKTGAL
jgi:hypothetical protein